jgi:hypothetical protein
MWRFSNSVIVKAEPSVIWELWKNTADWPRWDHDVEACSLNENFAIGARGRLKPRGGPIIDFEITELEPMKSFTDEAVVPFALLPLARLVFRHDIKRVSSETVEVTHTVEIRGCCSFLFAKLMGRQIAQGLPLAMQNLSKLAESRMSKMK